MVRERMVDMEGRIVSRLNDHSRVILLIIGLAAAGAVLHAAAIPLGADPATSFQLPGWLLAIGFAGTSCVAAHITTRRQTHTLTVTEIPLVVGLALASPLALLGGRLVGSALALVAWRRLPGRKVAFNLTLAYLETVAAIVVYRLVLSGAGPASGRGWLAALAAVAVVQVLGFAAVQAVITLSGATPPSGWLPRFAVSTKIALGAAAIAMVGLHLSDLHPMLVLATAPAAAVAVTAVTRTVDLIRRSEALSRAAALDPVVQNGTPDMVLTELLACSIEALHGEAAEIVVLVGDEPRRMFMDLDGEIVALPVDAEALQAVGRFTLDGLMTQHDHASSYVTRRGYRNGIVVPLPGEADAIGLVAVFNRIGPDASFATFDTGLLRRIAATTSPALR